MDSIHRSKKSTGKSKSRGSSSTHASAPPPASRVFLWIRPPTGAPELGAIRKFLVEYQTELCEYQKLSHVSEAAWRRAVWLIVGCDEAVIEEQRANRVLARCREKAIGSMPVIIFAYRRGVSVPRNLPPSLTVFTDWVTLFLSIQVFVQPLQPMSPPRPVTPGESLQIIPASSTATNALQYSPEVTAVPAPLRGPILFYDRQAAYYELTNFLEGYPIRLDDTEWKTTEHFFQGSKFVQYPALMRQLQALPHPRDAFEFARTHKQYVRSDWHDPGAKPPYTVKDEVMLRGLRSKFNQHEKLKELLLSTHPAELVEHTSNDRYWADGGDGSGKNMLGHLLMLVRDELLQDRIARAALL